ncbi:MULTISPECIES: phosphopantetheine-binding protein [Burkholderia]|uniref:Phosphopantetheine attachment site family protein n=1 Tax=Burkholderia cepacia TaxID=292 RepID=A0AA89CC54_BURCE|nr:MULTISPECIES: phosphopantetheine-binding protein [Burkholderia]KGB93353.1 phosphopantetheine attachment site family protein [Burkholderia cepacia]KWE59345.1 phosphopantetheine-binding protein [Burkholderia sp. MSMB2157WGS]
MQATRAIVKRLFSEALGVEHVASDADFFVLGGGSLAAAVLVTKIEQACGIEVSLLDFMNHATVDGFAGIVEQRLSNVA